MSRGVRHYKPVIVEVGGETFEIRYGQARRHAGGRVNAVVYQWVRDGAGHVRVADDDPRLALIAAAMRHGVDAHKGATAAANARRLRWWWRLGRWLAQQLAWIPRTCREILESLRRPV